jgi:hypothetical protein
MEKYIDGFDDYSIINVYDFQVGFGGIGDCIKYFMYLLEKSIVENIRLYYLINDIYLENYIQMRYDKMNIHRDELLTLKYPYTIINPFALYDNYDENIIKMPTQCVFKFSNEVILNKSVIFPDITNYITLHVRLGDKYLETDKRFVNCKNDVRSYNESNLIDFIEKNKEKNVLFCCDNNDFKRYIKNKYDWILLVDIEVAHTGLKNTNAKQILDSVTEFYIMAYSEKIVAGSQSGFSLMASKYRNIEIELLDNVDNKMIENNGLPSQHIVIKTYDDVIFRLSNNRRIKTFRPMNIT